MTEVQFQVSTDSKETIAFTPQEWERARWGVPPEPITPPPLRPFDLRESIERLLKMPKYPHYWKDCWKDHKVDPMSWSKQEAHFWLIALVSAHKTAVENAKTQWDVHAFVGEEPARLRATLGRATFSGNLSYREIETIASGLPGNPMHSSWIAHPVSRLLSPYDYVRLWFDRLLKSHHDMHDGFRHFIAPYAQPAELKDVRTTLQKGLSRFNPTNVKPRDRPPADFDLASLLNMRDEILPLLRSWPDNSFDNQDCQSALTLLFGLNDAQLIVDEARRLKVRLTDEDELYTWIRQTKHLGTELAYEVRGNPTLTKMHLEICSKIVSAKSGRELLRRALPDKDKEVRELGKKWVEAHPAFSIEPLADIAVGKGSHTETARRMLKDICWRTNVSELAPPLVEKLQKLGCLPEDDLADTTTERTEPPDWLAAALEAVAPRSKFKFPQWLNGVRFEKLCLDGYRFKDNDIRVLLDAFSQSTPDKLHPLVLSIREHLPNRTVCNRFVWDLFSRWVDAGGPPKDKWAIYALGYIGSEQLISQLLPLMYDWRQHSGHQRAMVGLEAIRIFGTDYALMQINDVAQSPKLKSLRDRAIQFMDQIAAERGLTKPQLEDRIVPTCGLDETGSRVFDYGARQFAFMFGPDLKPMVRDEKGQTKAELPAPNAKDDPVLAAQSVAEWKELKKILRDIAKVQARRLEQSMVTGRSWSHQDFDTLLLAHPLMTNLIRRVLWAALDETSGAVLKIFRILEDKSFADESDRALDLDPSWRLSIIHPLYMNDEQKSKWGEIFSDYEIISMFPQIGRPIFALQSDEQDSKVITRFASIKVPAVSVVSTLERLGWVRETAGDGGGYRRHFKHFDAQQITATVEYQGIGMYGMQEADDQSIQEIYFARGMTKAAYSGDAMPLRDVPPVVVSEVLYDIASLTSKGRNDP